MDHRPPGSNRIEEIRQLTGEMDGCPKLTEGQFNALGMLINDATIASDGPALEAAQDGLQWLCRRYSDGEQVATEAVHHGRLLGLIDVTHWALRRLPVGMQFSLDPDGHAARFLLAVAARPGMSNQELAAHLGVDETEVSRLGRRLLATGVVWRRREWRRNAWDVTPRGRQYVESSALAARLAGQPAGGPPEVVVPETGLTHAVGIKVLPDRLIGVVTDRDATVLAELRRPVSGPLSRTEICAEVAGMVRDLVDRVPEITGGLAGVGVGIEIGGHVSAAGDAVVSAPNYRRHGEWTGFPLARQLGDDLGVPAFVENDANALAEFEHAFGDNAGIGCTATVLLDEGIGCGIVVDGRLLLGSGGSAGELGHVVVTPDGTPCRCGSNGCLETVAGTLAITDAITSEEHKVPELATAATLAAEGNERAVEKLRTAGQAFGTGLLALLNLVNPEQVVLYGPPELVHADRYRSAELFLDAVREYGTQRAFSDSGERCTIIPKTYAANQGARAAAVVALLRCSGR
jgi:predicted NBD/HSP70 family sugar kinase